MPEFTYHGLLAMTYPESRQSDGTHVGTVEPGDTRDLPGPLDGDWRETTDEDRAAAGAPSPAAAKAAKTPRAGKTAADDQPGTAAKEI